MHKWHYTDNFYALETYLSYELSLNAEEMPHLFLSTKVVVGNNTEALHMQLCGWKQAL